MKYFNRLCALGLLGLCLLFTACREPAFSPDRKIHVMTREEGSGTRTAFEEIFGLQEQTGDGKNGSLTHTEAVVARSNGIVLAGVAADPAAVGYLSLGSLDQSVRALRIDGEEPTEDAIRSGKYPVVRAFSFVAKGELSPPASDFLNFVFSRQGQEIVSGTGYVRVSGGGVYDSGRMEGKLVLVGSSSVAPVAEKLKEAYGIFQPSVDVEIQVSDSTSGVRSADGGTCDFGMTSRKLNEGEQARGLREYAIALDGIAVVVHPDNSITEMTSEQVRSIYTGEAQSWRDAGAEG